MAESKQKVIERNRAPRVQIAYDVEHYGSPTTIELPFVMGVMADLAGQSETREAQKAIVDRAFVETDAGRFGNFMEALAPRVKARVPNRLPAGDGEEVDEELFVDLTFKNMGDFSPDKVAAQVPPLAELLKMRGQLEELLSYMDGKVECREAHRPAAAERAAAGRDRGRGDEGQTRRGGSVSMAEAKEQTGGAAAEAEAVDLGEFSELLEKDFRVKDTESEKLQALVQNLALAAKERAGTATISGNAVKSIKSLIAGIDGMLSAQMNEIVHAPEVREMEGTWRGLYYLVNNTETDQKLKIRVMNMKKEELADHLEEYEGQMWDQTPVFKKIYTEEYSMFGGEPFGWSSATTSSPTSPRTSDFSATSRASAPRRTRRSSLPPRRSSSAWKAGRSCRTRRTSADRLDARLRELAVAARERGFAVTSA